MGRNRCIGSLEGMAGDKSTRNVASMKDTVVGIGEIAGVEMSLWEDWERPMQIHLLTIPLFPA